MYVGVDYHKRFSVATQMDDMGKILQQVRLANDPEALTRFGPISLQAARSPWRPQGIGITSMSYWKTDVPLSPWLIP